MTYSTSPTLDADRYLTARDEEGAELDRAEKLLADEFRAAVRKGDVGAVALFAPRLQRLNHVPPFIEAVSDETNMEK